MGPHLTQCRLGEAYTSLSTGILIRPTVWPQYTNVTDRTDRQRSDSIERTVLQTAAQKAHIGSRHRQLLQAHLQSVFHFHTHRTSRCQTLLGPRQSTHSAASPAQQSAYRPLHSTETAVLSVHNDLVRAVDDCRLAQLVLLSLSAAFDTVDHQILFGVLCCLIASVT